MGNDKGARWGEEKGAECKKALSQFFTQQPEQPTQAAVVVAVGIDRVTHLMLPRVAVPASSSSVGATQHKEV